MAGGVGTPYMKLYNPYLKRASLLHITSVAILCSLFYLLGVWQHSGNTFISTANTIPNTHHTTCPPTTTTTKPTTTTTTTTTTETTLDFKPHHTFNATEELKSYPPCDIKHSEYTPCEDRERSLKFPREKLVYRERHCPKKGELMKCLVPAPNGYKNPFRWPRSRELAWFANVPHKELTVEKAVQNWIRVEGDKFRFPGGGTMFPRGADAYINGIEQFIPLRDGSIRTAIDTGCGELFRPLRENQQPLREEFRQQTRQTLREVKVGVNLNTDNRRPGCDRMRAEGFARGQPVAYNGVRRNSHYLPDYEDDLDDESGELYDYQPRKRHTYYNNYFSKVDISYFNGNLSIDKFLDWILEIDKFFEIIDVREEEMVRLVALRLTSGAANWWDHLQRTRQRQGRAPIRTWRKMRQLFMNQFLPLDCEQYLLQLYHNCRQGNRSVFDYTAEFLKFSGRYNLAEAKWRRVAHYLNGLRSTVRDLIASEEIYSLTEAISAAVKVESQLERSRVHVMYKGSSMINPLDVALNQDMVDGSIGKIEESPPENQENLAIEDMVDGSIEKIEESPPENQENLVTDPHDQPLVESEIDEDMANKEVEDVVLSVESKNIIGGEQEKLFSYSLVVIPEIEKPLQTFVLQTTCHINMSDFDVIVNNNIATTTVVDLIEKEFKIKKMSLLLPKVQYKDASNKMEEKVLISPIGVFDYIKYHPPDHLRSFLLKFEDEFF